MTANRSVNQVTDPDRPARLGSISPSHIVSQAMTAGRTRFAWATGVVLIPLMLLSGLAEASSQSHWSTVPATCTAGDGHLDATAKFRFDNNGSVTFANGETGVVVLFCEISNPMDDSWSSPAWTTAEVTYQDSGALDPERVLVDLVAVDMWSGASTVENLLDSNSYSPTAGWTTVAHPLSTWFDFSGSSYFIRVQLFRTDPKATEKVLYVGF